MSDLEELGYIIKPHTSAGRIPSDKGYRLYVNNLMKEKENEIKSLKTEMNARVDKLEDMLKTFVKTLANNTNYAAMIAGPSINNSKIKYIQLSNLGDKKVLIVVVAEGNVVKTKIVEFDKIIDAKVILDLNETLNNILSGEKVSNLNGEKVSLEIENLKKNKNVSDLVETFEQKKDLAKLVEKANNDNEERGLKVYIGEESSVNAMKDCSIVTANCDFGNGMKGTIGIVGPKRMDYEKVLKTIKNTMQSMNDDLK